MICDTMCKFDDHMTLRDFPRSRCGKSAGSIAFSVSLWSTWWETRRVAKVLSIICPQFFRDFWAQTLLAGIPHARQLCSQRARGLILQGVTVSFLHPRWTPYWLGNVKFPMCPVPTVTTLHKVSTVTWLVFYIIETRAFRLSVGCLQTGRISRKDRSVLSRKGIRCPW